MVRITYEHHRATRARALGMTYDQIAHSMGSTPDRVRQLIREWSRVAVLKLNNELDKTDGEDDGG